MKAVAGYVLLMAVIVLLIVDILSTSLSFPTVRVSSSTGACVEVLGHGGGCDNPPRKYHQEYVR